MTGVTSDYPPPATPVPAHWVYDFDPATGRSRTSYNGIVNAVISSAGTILSASEFDAVPDDGTDQSAHLQAFFDALTVKGGVGYIPPGDYHCASEVVCTITAPTTLDLLLLAAGANLLPLGGNSEGLFRVTGPNPYYTVTIQGLEANCYANATLPRAFAQNNTTNVTWAQCFVLADKNVSAGFKAWRLFQTDPDDGSTGCFWNAFQGGGVRTLSGADAPIPCAVHLDGAQNHTLFDGAFAIGACTKGILFTPPTGTTLAAALQPLANSVWVRNVAFEGNNDCVYFQNAAGGSGPYGLRINGARCENNVTLLNLDCGVGTTNRLSLPSIGADNVYTADGMVLLSNPRNLFVNIEVNQYGGTFDSQIYNNKTLTLSNFNPAATDPILKLVQANVGLPMITGGLYGSALKTFSLSYESSGVLHVQGNYAGFVNMYLSGVGGISATATRRKNLCGYVTLNGAGTGTVTFPTTETDTSYAPIISVYAAAAGNAAITAIRTNGFDVVGPANAVIYWAIFGR